jgi:hypothetical protein
MSNITHQLVSTSSVPNRGPAVFAVTTATLVVGTFFLIARLICRSTIVKRIGWDDYFIILAWFLTAGLSITIDISTNKGLGKHDESIDERNRIPLRKTEYVFSVLYVRPLELWSTAPKANKNPESSLDGAEDQCSDLLPPLV